MAKAEPTFHFEDPDTIQPPGWIGRAVRALFGYGSLNWIYQLSSFGDAQALSNLFVIGLSLFALQLIPYTVNIGFGVSLSFWPRLIAATGIAVAMFLGSQSTGDLTSPMLWNAVLVLNMYVFGHLGISFVLSALFRTAGCEMRAIPILLGRLTGKKARDHHCPGPIRAVDNWEQSLSRPKP